MSEPHWNVPDRFFVEQIADTPIPVILNGYISLSLDQPPDRARMRAIEESVAYGIMNWYSRLYERRRESGDYDYWLIGMGTAMTLSAVEVRTTAQAGAPLPDPASWRQFRLDLWIAMRAGQWLKFYDCVTEDDRLWRCATLLAYMKLFHGKFAEG